MSATTLVNRKSEKVLIIEDEADILEVIQYNLEREGYRVSTSRDGQQGLRQALQEQPDLLVLDLMLPGMDGLEICRRLRDDARTRTLPIIMVTAKGEESDIVLGLGLGADDYVTKPFSPRELVARISSVLRRGTLQEAAEQPSRIEQPGLIIDRDRHEVRIDEDSVTFTATELRLLHFLASHPGRVFTRDQLISRVIGANAVVLDRTIDVHVRAIRQKLGRHRDLLETVRGVGYRFHDARK